MPNPEITGCVDIRPTRMGLVFKPTLDALSKAIRLATASWGGMYFPFIDSTSESTALTMSAALDVDVLYAVDQTVESERLSGRDGYKWGMGGALGNPFAEETGFQTGRIQGMDWAYDDNPSFDRYAYNTWLEDHPLANLFAALYGTFGDDDFSRSAASIFERKAHSLDAGAALDEFGRWPDDPEYVTPIEFTTREIRYSGDSVGPAVVVTEAQDPARLCLLWNLRATGAQVIPWVLGFEEPSAAALTLWLDRMLLKNSIPRPTRGDGVVLDPHIHIYTPSGAQIPEGLAPVLADRGVTARAIDRNVVLAGGWSGSHPFHTDFSRHFRAEGSRRLIFDLGLPNIGNADWRRKHRPGFVMASITVSSIEDLPSDLVLVMPAMRELVAC